MRRRALLIGNKSEPFITVWKTDNTDANSTAANTIYLPFPFFTTFKLYVDWGDGTSTSIPAGTSNTSPLFTHTYAFAGIFTVKIYGKVRNWHWSPSYRKDNIKLLEVKHWGRFFPYDRPGLFFGCTNLNLLNVDGELNLSECWNFERIFQNDTSLSYVNGIENWDVSTVTHMPSAFSSATQFNQDLSNWATKIGNVTNMSFAFQSATSFNKDLSSWVPYMNLNVNLNGFMVGKSSANYDYQHVDNFLIAMASRSWAGRTEAKTISFGTCRRSTNSTTAYNALISDGWTITLSATVITP